MRGTKAFVIPITLAAVGVLSLIASARGDNANEHAASLPVRVTHADGSKRVAILIAQGPFANANPNPRMEYHTATGKVELWMDNLVRITAIDGRDPADKSSGLFTFRHGQPRRLNFGGFTEFIVVLNDDDTREVIDCRKIKMLEVGRASVGVSDAQP
jgi:hypothetical protein